MALIRDVMFALERVAPQRYAFETDKVGLQVGDPQAPITRAAYALDRSLGAIGFAAANGCQLLLSHHPLIYTPLDAVDTRSHVGRSVLELVKGNVAFIAAHTNWDSALGGINDELAKILGLQEVGCFGSGASVERLKLVTFCPESAAQSLIDALSEAGAGVIGAYSRCAFVGSGTGTFVGGAGAKPSIGAAGERVEAQELRVEMVAPAERSRALVRALQRVHPYEEPAYDLLKLEPLVEQPAGRIGALQEPMTLVDLAARIDGLLATRSWSWGDPAKKVRKVAIVGGAADGEWMNAQRAGADVFLTGEVRQHIAVEASESGMPLIAAGHYATENPGAQALGRRMATELPEIEWISCEPDAGLHGRPF